MKMVQKKSNNKESMQSKETKQEELKDEEVNNEEDGEEEENQENEEENNPVDDAKEGMNDAKEIAKIGANAAAGNYAKAAVDGIKMAARKLKDKKFRKKLIKMIIMKSIPIILMLVLAAALFGVFNAMKDKMIDLIGAAYSKATGFLSKAWKSITNDNWVDLGEKFEYVVDLNTGETLGTQETIKNRYTDENGKTETAADESGGTAADGVRTSYSIPVTTVTVDTYDISDKEHPKKTGSYQQDGRYLSSRRNGGRLYLFTSYAPDTGEGADQLQYYIPRSGEEYISCDHIYLPAPDEDFFYNGKVFLVTGAVSPEQPDQASDIMAVASNADIFYVSAGNIYSATETWNASETRTEIIRIGYESGKFTDGATGSVKGELNNNFSMDEYDGKLRIVTTVGGWDADYINYLRDNSLYVLDDTLHVIGKIENLAENEQIKSARFMGETGYFVTYRNTDPLFAVDLSDPENPAVLSELKITGFSEYLHFYGENRLLGIGWETDPDTGNVSGMKCSMFDLSDPSEVREMDRFILKNVSFCDALYNYRAILASSQKNLFGFAYGIYGSTDDRYDYSENFYYGLFSYDEEKGFDPQMYLKIDNNELFNGDMSYQEYRKVRGVYIGNRFYLVTERGIVSYDMQKDYATDKTLKWED